jgi:hypothetical protein
METGTATDDYYYVKDGARTVIVSTGDDDSRLIWGEQVTRLGNGSDARVFKEFFVGSKTEFLSSLGQPRKHQ